MDIVEREKRDPIEIVDYDPGWPERFESLAEQIRGAIGEVAHRIEHIGSTSVTGLAAKPVIDILVSVRSFDPLEAYGEALERLGFAFRPDDQPQHRFFFDAANHPRTVHVHVCEAGSESERRHLLFREYLRSHPDVAEEYARRKRDLAGRYRDDRKSYAEGKDPFVESAMRAAEAWAEEQNWSLGR